jgi:hypothetical protein
VTDAEYEKLASRFSGDGVYGDPTDTAVVSAGVGLTVVVRAGVQASVRGHAWTSGDTDFTLPVTANSSGSTRTDWVVLRLDRSTWDVNAAIREGTPGSGAPTLSHADADTGVYEIPLALVTVPDSATSVTVRPYTHYVGSRVRPCTSTTHPLWAAPGQIVYETDTSRWIAWNGQGLTTLYEDSGTLTISAGYVTWTQHIANVGRQIGPIVWLRIGVKRAGSDLASGADATKIGVIPSALRFPHYSNYYAGRFSNGQSGRLEVKANGEIWVDHISGAVPIGETLVATLVYMQF